MDPIAQVKKGMHERHFRHKYFGYSLASLRMNPTAQPHDDWNEEGISFYTDTQIQTLLPLCARESTYIAVCALRHEWPVA